MTDRRHATHTEVKHCSSFEDPTKYMLKNVNNESIEKSDCEVIPCGGSYLWIFSQYPPHKHTHMHTPNSFSLHVIHQGFVVSLCKMKIHDNGPLILCAGRNKNLHI